MSRTKSNAKAKARQQFHNEFLSSNPIPIPTEFNQKKFTVHDMKSIQPMTPNQECVFNEWADGYNLVLNGSAGTGKSLVSIYLGLKEIMANPGMKLVLLRSAVPSRESGFLPGTLEEKMEVYEQPYVQIFDFLFKKKNQYKHMKEAGLVEFHSTSYLRGTTFDDSIIILDEAASMNYHEISTVLTRTGINSRVVVIGDTKQNDLIYKKSDTSGFDKFLKVADHMSSIKQVRFVTDDIVRSGFVKEFLIADELVG